VDGVKSKTRLLSFGLSTTAQSAIFETNEMENEFVDAAACGDLDGVQELLADAALAAAVINAVDKDGRSAFHYACLNDDVPLLTVLLGEPRVDKALTSPNGDTALHMAALYAALEALKLLFADAALASALLGAQNKFGETALHLCAGSGDKGAHKAALLLLGAGASLASVDKWGRGPLDVSRDNAENPLVSTFAGWLGEHPEQQAAVDAVTAAYAASKAAAVSHTEEAQLANKAAKMCIFGQLGGVKLKKTEVKVKSMFSATEGRVTEATAATAAAAAAGGGGGGGGGGGAKAANAAVAGTGTTASDGRRALSKLIDFPGDVAEITAHLANAEKIDPAGADAYGLTALHKFASWNKTELLALLLPTLATPAQLNAKDPEGKTALHWAVEMASVGAVKALVRAGLDVGAEDGKGRTVGAILDAVEQSGVIERLKKALVLEE